MAVQRPGRMAPIDASRAILWRPVRAGDAVPNLYWAPQSRCPVGEGIVAYSTDDKPEFAYEAFNAGRDFGPLDIARTVMYCRWVDALCIAHAGCTALIHITSDVRAEDRANTVVLCGAYLVLALGRSADDAFRPFSAEPLAPFLDCRGESSSGGGISDEEDTEFELTVLDILRGLERVRDLGWINYRTFGVEDHSSMLRPENGDMSWLLPGIALALASPWAEPHDQDGLPVCTPALLSSYMLRHWIGLIVQCNHPEREEEGDRRRLLCYEPKNFEDIGIKHLHLPFEDGGCPSVEIILKFLEVVVATGSNFGVHCRSGLGRTATLIGAYAMQNFGFSARSFIGWARVMRPGTVHGSQQQYLVNLEPHLRHGTLRTLSMLDQRERLRLLPRRELRFWALDAGIPAARTRFMHDNDIIELILVTQSLHAPSLITSAQLPMRSIPPVTLPSASGPHTSESWAPTILHNRAIHTTKADSLLNRTPIVSRAPLVNGCHASGAAAMGMLSGTAPVGATASAPSVSAGTVSGLRGFTTPTVAPSSIIGPRAVPPATSSAVPRTNAAKGFNAPIASLSQSSDCIKRREPPLLGQTPALALSSNSRSGNASVAANQDGRDETRAVAPAPSPVARTCAAKSLNAAIASLSQSSDSVQRRETPATTSNVKSGSAPSSSNQDEWDEILRYLRLLMAVQAEGAPSWQNVKHSVQQLRDMCLDTSHKVECGGKPVFSNDNNRTGGNKGSDNTLETEAVQEMRAARQAAAREAETRDTELRAALQQARELQRECEQLKFRIALEREARLTERKRMADHGEALANELQRDEIKLERAVLQVKELREQVLKQDGLKQWQVERAERLQHEIAETREATFQHGAKCQEQRARLNATQQEKHQLEKEMMGHAVASVAGSENKARRNFQFTTPSRSPETLSETKPAWDDARNAIERLRDQFQLAVQQARVTIAAS